MKCNVLAIRAVFTLVVSISICATASAQSFNIDLDIQGGPPEGGNGTPTSSFGAAANQPGFWNNNAATGQPPMLLRDLSGALTNVVFNSPNGGIGNGFNNPNLTGDFRLLMSDGRFLEDDTWSFSGLSNGVYRLYTYSVRPSGGITNTIVTVPGAYIPVQNVTGPMPPNQFLLGITHCIHEINVTSGELSVRVQRAEMNAYLNGFQLVAVPEPSLLLTFGLGSLCVLKRKQRQR